MKNVADLHKEKGWSQTELSKKCAVSREITSKYGRGEDMPLLSLPNILLIPFVLACILFRVKV